MPLSTEEIRLLISSSQQNPQNKKLRNVIKDYGTLEKQLRNLSENDRPKLCQALGNAYLWELIRNVDDFINLFVVMDHNIRFLFGDLSTTSLESSHFRRLTTVNDHFYKILLSLSQINPYNQQSSDTLQLLKTLGGEHLRKLVNTSKALGRTISSINPSLISRQSPHFFISFYELLGNEHLQGLMQQVDDFSWEHCWQPPSDDSNVSKAIYRPLFEMLGSKHLQSLTKSRGNLDHLTNILPGGAQIFLHQVLGSKFYKADINECMQLCEQLPIESIQNFLSHQIGPQFLQKTIRDTITLITQPSEADKFSNVNGKVVRIVDQLRKLLKLSPLNVLNHADTQELAPLHCCMTAGDIDSTWILLLKGVDISAQDTRVNSSMESLQRLFTSEFQNHELITQCQTLLDNNNYSEALSLIDQAQQNPGSALLYAAVKGRMLILLHEHCISNIAGITSKSENAYELKQTWLERVEDIEKKLNFYLDWQKVSEACTKTPAPSQQSADAQPPQAEAGTVVSSQVAGLGNR